MINIPRWRLTGMFVLLIILIIAGYSLILKLNIGMFLTIFITLLLIIVVSIYLTARVSGPLAELTQTVEAIAQGNLKRRIFGRFEHEWGILAAAINDMATNLEDNVKTMTEVNHRLEAVLTNSVNGILMLSDHRIVYANPKAIDMLGLEPDYNQRSWVEVLNNYSILAMIDLVQSQINSLSQEVQLHQPVEKILDVNVVPILIQKTGEMEGILVVLNDISVLKRFEQVRKDFIANVSHELKTPVAVISGFAETLLEEENPDADHIKEFSHIIYDEARRLERIIGRLLELSRLEAAEYRLNLEKVSLPQLITDAVQLIRHRYPDQNLSITTVFPPVDVVLTLDADAIGEAIYNLLDNAVKYSDIEKKIEITLLATESNIKVSIQDNGEGIAERHIDRLFERFYRIDQARSRKTGGTGLGLAIVKHIIENHGGQVKVESYPGQGAKFYFTLPR